MKLKAFAKVLAGVIITTSLIIMSCEREPNEVDEIIEEPEEEVTEGVVSGAVTDYDGNNYNGIWLGDQLWMKENLRTTHYADGTKIPLGFSSSSSIAYRYYPENDSSNVNKYGYLYNWRAVMYESFSSDSNPSGVQGICPNGWHVPSYAEWLQLANYVKSQNQYLCSNGIAKALADTTGWVHCDIACAVGNNQIENNVTGFGALPAGNNKGNEWLCLGYSAIFSSTTTCNGDIATFEISYCSKDVGGADYYKNRGYSVRCVHD